MLSPQSQKNGRGNVKKREGVFSAKETKIKKKKITSHGNLALHSKENCLEDLSGSSEIPFT